MGDFAKKAFDLASEVYKDAETPDPEQSAETPAASAPDETPVEQKDVTPDAIKDISVQKWYDGYYGDDPECDMICTAWYAFLSSYCELTEAGETLGVSISNDQKFALVDDLATLIKKIIATEEVTPSLFRASAESVKTLLAKESNDVDKDAVVAALKSMREGFDALATAFDAAPETPEPAAPEQVTKDVTPETPEAPSAEDKTPAPEAAPETPAVAAENTEDAATKTVDAELVTVKAENATLRAELDAIKAKMTENETQKEPISPLDRPEVDVDAYLKSHGLSREGFSRKSQEELLKEL